MNPVPEPRSGAASEQLCSRCQTPNLPKAKFCAECGTPLRVVSGPDPAAAQEPVPPAQEKHDEATRPSSSAREDSPASAEAGTQGAPGEAEQPQWGRLSVEELKKLKREVTLLLADLARPSSDAAQTGVAQSVMRLEQRDALLLPLIEELGGTLLKKYGYSVLVRFDEPAAALHAAISIQKAFAEHNASHAAREPIRLRMAVTTGRAVVLDKDIFGEIVNAVGRLCKQSSPEGIVVSETVFRTLMDHSEFQFRPGPENIFEVVWGTPVSPAASPAGGGQNTCPSCGTQNLEKAMFCGHCGTRLQQPTGDDRTIVAPPLRPTTRERLP